MKTVSKFKHLFYGLPLAILFISFYACTEELAVPKTELISQDLLITNRSEGPVSPLIIKQKVADRDNIPLVQILTCSYFGETSQGYWEYHLTTSYDGPKIYTVTKIIGDVNDGF